MKDTDFKDMIADKINECTDILTTRGAQYAGDDDFLRNFKQTAELMNDIGWQFQGDVVTPELVAAMFVQVKVQRWFNRIREGQDPEDDYTDIINYVLLAKGCRIDSSTIDVIHDSDSSSNIHNVHIGKE